MSRDFYLEEYDPERWPVENRRPLKRNGALQQAMRLKSNAL